jgi:hypothetical protein|tara:strand:+ start:955 stop:1164 length:210 start_codon:yes stop_codon:yes gene_type:complete
MAILKVKAPRINSIVDVDASEDSIIVLDDSEIVINGRVGELIANLIEENTVLCEKVNTYEQFLGGVVNV